MKKHPPTAFTLIEIIVCMVIFSVGFAAVAMMLPAGAVMQRDIEASGIGDIVGKNSLEVMKAKGVQSLTYDYKATNFMPMGVECVQWSFLSPAKVAANGLTGKDMDAMLAFPASPPGYGFGPPGNYAMYCPTARAQMAPYFDTNGNGNFVNLSPGQGGYALEPAYDGTNMLLGRIGAYKERPIPGITPGRTSLLDFSYPSSVLDITARTYVSVLLQTNQSLDGMPGTIGSYMYSTPASHAWQLTAVTLKSNGTDEWPEQIECDRLQTAAAQFTGDNMQNPDLPPKWLCSNTPVDFRSAWGDSSLVGTPSSPRPPLADPGPVFLWPTYIPSPSAPSSQGTVPVAGGNTGNAACNGWLQGWCDMGDYGNNIRSNRRVWNAGDLQPALVSELLALPIRDPVESRYGYYPAGAPGPYRYPVPNVISVLAIVYDRDKDLLLLRYPQNFARTLVETGKGETTNARVAAYRTACGIGPNGENWQDRKLKVGDKFMTARGGYPFTVKELLDPVAEAAKAPGVGAVNWSDGTYQVVRVSPSLRTTFYTANKPVGVSHPSRWSDPLPGRALVAPPPVSGGPSPWVSTVQLIDGGTTTKNGAVFRQWDNLTD